MAIQEKTNGEKLAELEYQLKLFEDGIKSSFWQLLVELWKPVVDSATGYALSPTATDRSFMAGKANGLHYFLNYPAKHIKKLQLDIKTIRNSTDASKTR